MPHLSEAGGAHSGHAAVAAFSLGGRRSHAHQRGVSLVEALAFLGIAAAVLLGAISLLNMAVNSAGIEQARTEITATRMAIKRLYTPPYGNGSVGSPTALTSQMVNSFVFPDSLVVDKTNATVKNRWGGAVKIFAIPERFWITYENVPREICVGLISGASGWHSISVNSEGAWSTVLSFPAAADVAEGVCASNTNLVQWSST